MSSLTTAKTSSPMVLLLPRTREAQVVLCWVHKEVIKQAARFAFSVL
jgi:hypothetical protein